MLVAERKIKRGQLLRVRFIGTPVCALLLVFTLYWLGTYLLSINTIWYDVLLSTKVEKALSADQRLFVGAILGDAKEVESAIINGAH